VKEYKNATYFGQLSSEGNREGLGVLCYESGRRYEGEFKLDMREGKGFEYFPSGNTYEGEYLRD